jgi:hypothetical protein
MKKGFYVNITILLQWRNGLAFKEIKDLFLEAGLSKYYIKALELNPGPSLEFLATN